MDGNPARQQDSRSADREMPHGEGAEIHGEEAEEDAAHDGRGVGDGEEVVAPGSGEG